MKSEEPSKVKVLYIDDSESDLELFRTVFDKHLDLVCLDAVKYLEGLDLSQYRIVITDVMIPGFVSIKDFADFWQKKKINCKETLFIAFSGMHREVLLNERKLDTCFDYIVEKNFGIDFLQKIVNLNL